MTKDTPVLAKYIGIGTVLVLVFVMVELFLPSCKEVRFSIFGVVLFYFCCATCIQLLMTILINISPNQGAYGFLLSICVKIGLFLLIFKTTVFGLTNLFLSEKLMLVSPLFAFLLLEVLYVKYKLDSV
jgi:hypothetical protein